MYNGPASATDPCRRVPDERGFRRAACNPLESLEHPVPRGVDVVVLPLGSFEWHGSNPAGLDTLISCKLSQLICEEVSRKCDVSIVVLPPVVYTASSEWLEFGAASVSRRTLLQYLLELVESIIKSLEVNVVVLVNSHGGNSGLLKVLRETLVYERRVTTHILVYEWWREARVRLDHGGDIECSLALGLGLVRGVDKVLDCDFGHGIPRCKPKVFERVEGIVEKVLESIGVFAERVCSLVYSCRKSV